MNHCRLTSKTIAFVCSPILLAQQKKAEGHSVRERRDCRVILQHQGLDVVRLGRVFILYLYGRSMFVYKILSNFKNPFMPEPGVCIYIDLSLSSYTNQRCIIRTISILAWMRRLDNTYCRIPALVCVCCLYILLDKINSVRLSKT